MDSKGNKIGGIEKLSGMHYRFPASGKRPVAPAKGTHGQRFDKAVIRLFSHNLSSVNPADLKEATG